MRPNPREQRLMVEIPLMRCFMRIEFQQRLQWLSEGMLANNLYPPGDGKPSQHEINAYKWFKEKPDDKQTGAA